MVVLLRPRLRGRRMIPGGASGAPWTLGTLGTLVREVVEMWAVANV
jgi:hypothetical protein